MQQMNVDELKPHPRNGEFFDDMTGETWKAFLDSVKTSGVIEPVVITPDKVIVSGHQRVRACKELGIPTVLADMRDYSDDDKILKDLIETNIRQRGVGNPNPVKLGRCIKELERIYGIKHGNNRYNRILNDSKSMNQEQLASILGISVDTLINYKKLTELIPEVQDLIDTGVLKSTTALALARHMSPKEQEDFVSSLDATKKITQRQVQQYINEISRLNAAKKAKIKNNADNSKKIAELESQNSILKCKVELNQADADKFNKLKSDMEFLIQQRDDIGRQIDSATELAGLTVRLQKLLEEELAPIKYKRCMEVLGTNSTSVSNLVEVIDKVENWLTEIKRFLPDKYNDFIEVV